MKKIISILMTICLVSALTLAATPTCVSASALGIPYAQNTGCGLTAQEVKAGGFFRMFFPQKKLAGGRIAKVTSSNKKVAGQIKIDTASTFTFIVKKYGKTTFTITVKTGNKKTKTYKCNFIAAKYVCPVSSIKLGTSSNLASKFKNGIIYDHRRPTGATAAKISVKPKTGWMVTSITHSYYDKRSINKNIKNNSTIKYPNDPLYESIYIDLKNKKNGIIQSLVIQISQSTIIYI